MNVLRDEAKPGECCTPWYAVCLSEVWPGLGTMRAGRHAFESFLLAAFLGCWCLGMLQLYLPSGNVIASFLCFGIVAVLWFYSLFHAHKSARGRSSSDLDGSRTGPHPSRAAHFPA